MNSTLETIDKRSSIRKYLDKEIPEDILNTLIEAGLKAPTATNRQELHFSAVSSKNPVQQDIQNDLAPQSERTFYYGAPVTIYISAEDSFKWSDVDAGIAVENIHLAAASLGLGSVVLGCMRDIVNGERKPYYDEKLNIPEGYSFRVAIAVGYPNIEKEPHKTDFGSDVSILD
ncbi:MAG: nitroreductase family protein [Erysipelotrichaceae bacterium]|nr:nitroreductase family protein [Erysipelotrichaceae bacterium]